jgi:acyl-CoA synthetase (AMP-forming)/AMP-acid ligase II
MAGSTMLQDTDPRKMRLSNEYSNKFLVQRERFLAASNGLTDAVFVDPSSGSKGQRFLTSQIFAMSEEWARVFKKLQAGTGAVLIIPMRTSIDSICALFGALEAGLFPVLIKPTTPVDLVLETISKTSGGYVLIPLRSVASYVERGGRSCGVGYMGYQVVSCNADGCQCTVDYPAIGISSSGSTGNPKIIVQPLENLISNAEMHINSIGLQSDDMIGLNLPLYFSYGLVAGAFGTILRGAQGILVDSTKLNPQAVYAEAGLTVGMATPSTVRSTFGFYLLRKLKTLTVGGDVLHSKTALRLLVDAPNTEILSTYGLSEAGPRVATSRLSADLISKYHAVPLGIPLKGVAYRIQDDGGDRKENAGELLITTPTAMTEYLNDSAMTSDAFTLDRASLRSGDIFRMKDEHYFFVSRKKRIIVRGGENIYPAFVEARILSNTNITDIWVAGVPQSEIGELPKAFVVSDERIDFDIFAKQLRRILPTSNIPVFWEQVEELPPNARK